MNDKQLLEEIAKTEAELQPPLRTGAQVVAAKDAFLAALDVNWDKTKSLDEEAAQLEIESNGLVEWRNEIAAERRILQSDQKALEFEVSRLTDEVNRRFQGDWVAAAEDTGPRSTTK